MHQRYSNRFRAGFTLLEILLVLVLVSLASVAVISTLPTSAKDESKIQAKSLYQRLLLINEEAMLSGRDYGLRVDEKKSAYYLMTLETEGWKKLNIDQIPYETKLEDSVVIALSLSGSTWDDDRLFKPGGLFDDDLHVDLFEKKKLPPPQIFIVSSGEVTPFTVSIYPQRGDEEQDAWKVIAKENGQIVLLAPGESLDES
ncbi:type II secretion system minor pseudopilin GspH [Vibrio sp. OCN044]|uniref:Type II secretion system protein H n=1 Tax=Vibrio tetraodonis subsp. pristinus TaxID=2695891 RepID=A0A6L8LXG4_9VIBR|nr:type II secretion system minor pseudopilin GspH [Vibrio tetraodonis]MYM60824.1 type II secretion system minor pseudopilin GspH [Vibrio tetraodonis subsp. pristinus]